MKLQRTANKAISNRLTKREFIMLSLLALVLEGFLIGKYLVLPKWDEYSQLKSLNESRQTLVQRLKADFDKTGQYQQELEKIIEEKNQMKASIPSYVSQEEALILLDTNAKKALLNIGIIGFETVTAVQSDVFVTQDGKNEGSAPKEENVALAADNTKNAIKAPMVLSQSIAVNFSGDYNTVYSFVKSLETNPRKVYLRKISLNSSDTSILSGSFTLEFLSYVDAENYDEYMMDITQNQGKKNPFIPYSGFGKNSKPVAAEVEADPDFYILLNSYLDNAQKVIMGQYPKEETEIHSNKNDQIPCKLVITGDDKSFGYSMTLGSVTRNSTQNVSVEKGAIRVKIISMARKDAKDMVGITLDVENKTGVPVELQVLFDDKDRPRVSMGNLKGDIKVK